MRCLGSIRVGLKEYPSALDRFKAGHMNQNEIIETQDGSHSIYSPKFGVTYHSKYGAVQESRHVFIESGLFYVALTRKDIAVLEIGLGTGLNALLTLIESQRRQLRIQYEAVEAFPLSMEQARRLNHPSILESGAYQDQFLAMHEAAWGRHIELSPAFEFKKELRHFEEIDYSQEFDLVYFDAFAPDAQPELWDLPVLSRVYEALRPGGILVTYCAKGVVKRRLKSLGFEVESLKGPPGKREMTRAVKQ